MDKLQKYGFKKEYIAFLLIYLLANIFGTIWMINSGELIGDFNGIKIKSMPILIFSGIIVVLSYILILVLLFNYISKIKFPTFNNTLSGNHKKLIAKIILILQVLYLIYNLNQGVNIAGSVSKASGIIGYFWIFTPIDTLFLIYYALCRQNNLLFKSNLTVYVISNLLRGWSGIFIYIFFFEWCRLYREKKIKARKILLIATIGIALYPFLLNIKWIVRSSAASSLGITELGSLFINNVTSIDYFSLLEKSTEQLLGRVQHVSNVASIANYSNNLQNLFNSGKILPFWEDGLPQLAVRTFLGIKSPNNVGVAVVDYMFVGQITDTAVWNTNIGFVGWFFIAPNWSLIYIIYTIFLCVLSIYITKLIVRQSYALDVVWLGWLAFLMPSWNMAFVGFVYSLFLFLIIVLITRKKKHV